MLLSFMILLCCVSCLLCCYYWVCLVHHHHYDGNCSCMINSQWSELCHHYQPTLFVQGWGRKTENIDLIMLSWWLTHCFLNSFYWLTGQRTMRADTLSPWSQTSQKKYFPSPTTLKTTEQTTSGQLYMDITILISANITRVKC